MKRGREGSAVAQRVDKVETWTFARRECAESGQDRGRAEGTRWNVDHICGLESREANRKLSKFEA